MDILLKLPITLFLSASTALASATLNGRFTSDCTPLPKRHSITSEIRAVGTQISAETVLYADSDCKRLNLTIEYVANFSTGPDLVGGIALDLLPTKIMFTLRNTDVVSYYNANNSCGVSDWVLDKPRNVSGKFCFPSLMPTVGQTGFDIFELKGGILQFGVFPQAESPKLPDERPHSVSDKIIYFRQSE
jgi:hypothetical protein